MFLTYKQNINNKLYAQSFLEVRIYSEEYRIGAPITIVLDGNRWNDGRITLVKKKPASDLDEIECLLAFGIGKEETLRLLAKIYGTQMPQHLLMSILVISQTERKQVKQEKLFS